MNERDRQVDYIRHERITYDANDKIKSIGQSYEWDDELNRNALVVIQANKTRNNNDILRHSVTRYTRTFNGWVTEEHLFDYSFYDFKQVWVFDDYALALDSKSEKIWAIFYKQKKFKDKFVDKNYMVVVNSELARARNTFEQITFRDSAKNGRFQMMALIR